MDSVGIVQLILNEAHQAFARRETRALATADVLDVPAHLVGAIGRPDAYDERAAYTPTERIRRRDRSRWTPYSRFNQGCSSAKVIVVSPTLIMSLLASFCLVTVVPFTRVPLVLFRSSIQKSPSTTRMRAWWRETWRSST